MALQRRKTAAISIFHRSRDAFRVGKHCIKLLEHGMKRLLFLTFLLTQLSACSAEIGSDKWCEDLKEKAKGEWTANEAKDFTKHCLFN